MTTPEMLPEDKLQRRYLNGLLFTLLLSLAYGWLLYAIDAMSIVQPIIMKSLPGSSCNDPAMLSIKTFLYIASPFTLLGILFQCFFALYARQLWIKHHPGMKRWIINVICWGTFLFPLLFNFAVIANPIWKKKSAWLKWLFVMTILYITVFDFFMLVYLNDERFYYVFFLGLLLMVLCYISAATVKWFSLSMKLIFGPVVVLLLILSFLYISAGLKEREWKQVSTKLTACGIPITKEEVQKYHDSGRVPDENSALWMEAAKEIKKLAYEKSKPGKSVYAFSLWELTPERIAERDAYLEQMASAMETIDSLVYKDFHITLPIVSTEDPAGVILENKTAGFHQLSLIYAMRMQAAMEGENPDTAAALEYFRRFGELFKQCDAGLIFTSIATKIGGVRLSALADLIASGKLTREELLNLELGLLEEEEQFLQLWRHNSRMEVGWELAMMEYVKNGGKIQDGSVIFTFKGPCHKRIIAKDQITAAKASMELLPVIDDISSDYWQLPLIPVPEFSSYIANLCWVDWNAMLLRKYHYIAQIRGARVALRRAAGLETDDIRDPFMNAPMQIFEGEFTVDLTGSGSWQDKWVVKEQEVRGTRIFSEGFERIKTDPKILALLKGYNQRFLESKTPASFDIIFEKVDTDEQ